MPGISWRRGTGRSFYRRRLRRFHGNAVAGEEIMDLLIFIIEGGIAEELQEGGLDLPQLYRGVDEILPSDDIGIDRLIAEAQPHAHPHQDEADHAQPARRPGKDPRSS